MRRFKNLLVCVGGGPAAPTALARAVKLARENGAAVKLLDVIEDLPWYARLVLPTEQASQNLLAGEREARLESLAESIRGEGIEATAKLLRGRPYLEAVREVLRDKHDLVLKDAEDEGSGLFGSTDMHLLRECPCPVWLVKPVAQPFRRILAAVDAEPGDETRKALNLKILDLAVSIAEWEGGETHVIHAWSIPGEIRLRSRTELLAKDEVDAYVEDMRVEVQKSFDDLLLPFAPRIGVNRTHLIKGDPSISISTFVETQGVDLIVMGTVARTGVPGLLIGNTAEKVLNQVRCSVLTAKPDGFVSSIRADSDAN